MRDRFATKKISAGLVISIAAAVLVIATLAAYMGLCVWVQGGDQLLPGTVLVDSRGEAVADLGKLTREEALDVVSEAMLQQMGGHGLLLLYGEDKQVELSGSLISGSAESAVDLGFATKNSKPNWKLGMLWLGVKEEPIELSMFSSILTPQGEAQAKSLIASIAGELSVEPVDFTYELDGDSLVVTPGTDGSKVDRDVLLEAVKEALLQGKSELRVDTEPVSGAELSGAALRKLVQVDPEPASVDEDGNLVPAVVGLSVNAEEAQAILDAAAPGDPCTIPLAFIPPEPAEDESMFYQDLLAQYTLELSEDAATGAAGAAATCNGKKLQPGEMFSCLDSFGQTAGSGIDQTASALYYCAVYSNLSVAERTGGVYAPDYIPAGLDAAIAAPSQDLKFRNSTGFPVKIAASVDNNQLAVKFYGSNPDGIKVEVQPEIQSTTAWTTVYQSDTSIKRGTTTESVIPAEGCVVDMYRCVYNADGKLVSRNLENTSTYEKRDQVILYNPADSGPWGAGTASRPSGNTKPARPPATKPATPKPSTPEPTTPEPTTPEPVPEDRPPEVSMPEWMQPTTPSGDEPTDTETPAQDSMPEWLN